MEGNTGATGGEGVTVVVLEVEHEDQLRTGVALVVVAVVAVVVAAAVVATIVNPLPAVRMGARDGRMRTGVTNEGAPAVAEEA